MKINRVTFSAIGPFKGQHTIDFDQLNGDAPYLIDGPTGAGKSTIIDAIVFALYGEVAGSQADVSRMRSDFADPGDETYVELEFTVSSGSYRVRRNPSYMREAKRGGGLTPENSRATLARIQPGGGEEPIASQVGRVAEELKPLLGLSKQQFAQTVVLPQGEFAEFLRANTKQREELLKAIFNTELYTKIADSVKAQAQAAQTAQSTVTAGIKSQLDQLQGQLQLPVELHAQLTDLIEQSLDEQFQAGLDALRPALADAVAEARKEFAAADEAHTAAKAAHNLAKDEATAGQNLAAADAAVARAAAAQADAESRLRAVSAVAAEVGVSTASPAAAGEWAERVAAVAKSLGELKNALEAEATIRRWPARLLELEQGVESAQKAVDDINAEKAVLPAQIAEQREVASKRDGLQAAADDSKAKLNALKLELEAHRAASAQVEKAELAESALASLAVKANAAETEAHAAKTAFIGGQAARLALELVDGEPCPVCGGLEHPRPAVAGGEVPDEQQLEELEREASKAREALTTARAKSELERSRADELQATLPRGESEVAAEEKSTRETHSKLLADLKTAAEAAVRLAELQQRSEQLLTSLTPAEAAVATAIERLANETAAHSDQERLVEKAKGSHPSVAERQQALTELQQALAAMQSAVVVVEGAETQRAEAAAARAKFPDRDGFADVDSAAAAETDAQAALLERSNAEQEAARNLEAFDERRDEMLKLIEQRARRSQDSLELLELARVFNISPGNKMSLNIFVLRQLFDQVLVEANRRFSTLLEGRYRLVTAEATDGDGRGAKGLGIDVEDMVTGKRRAARSLSGGESFCASLALALGLADIVRYNAGGIDIGTLFIDEGFGSLDGTRLDDVMKMLNGLRAAGRTVGLISHVDDMKAQIAEKIEVQAATRERPATLTVTWME